ncbi:hypothetical protein EWT60_00845 [Escherichia coli O25b:H4]|nr:hypothetical protein EWT60_00025 [Escherichia coli O25b:H4]TLI62633.1 hypothetical protein EWT60_00845 [Escherichia coli O25b:H4]
MATYGGQFTLTGSSWLRDLIYWYMPTALLRGIFHNVPDSCFRQWIK